jgi:hypothetical protein
MTQEERVPKIAPDIVWRLLDGNAVVVSPREGEVRVLNSVGTAIWQRLVENDDLLQIEEYLESHYDVTQQRVHGDLLTFLEELTERGILVWDEAAS